MKDRRMPVALLLLVALALGCTETTPTEANRTPEAPLFDSRDQGNPQVAAAMRAIMDDMNVALAAEGSDQRVAMVEYVTGAGDEAGATVVSKTVGNKQLAFDFVPFDPRRTAWSGPVSGSTDDITYVVDQVDAVPAFGGLNAAQTTAAIDASMVTWEAASCSDLPITRTDDLGLDLGLIFGADGALLADVTHAGWGDVDFAPGILGATFTFGFIDAFGFTDIDNNGRLDAAFREIYYDPSFSWANDGVTDFDVEAVALHEAGHGLSQGHFGNILVKNDGTLKRAPAAIMNPFILGQTRTLLGTDNAGHCSIWGQWPQN